jgi:ABC-type branched-subunit amino acid transport system substrate-binding protein
MQQQTAHDSFFGTVRLTLAVYRRLVLALVIGLTALATPTAWAQLLIGQSSGVTGPVAAGVKENIDGAQVYFKHINSRGGVNGQRIELLTLDDRFDAKLTVDNARKLITEHKVLALFMTRGTPHTQAVMPLLSEYKLPLVAPSTGAMVLHKPVHPWVFNVRASYQREAEKAIAHLTTIGLTRIGVIHVDDSFGADVYEGANKGFEKAKLKPVFLEKFDRTAPDFAPLARLPAKHQAQAIFLIGSSGAVAQATQLIRATGSRAQVVTVSNNASSGFIKLMGEHARGTIVSQVFPFERSIATPMVKEAMELAAAQGFQEVTPAMLEGYAGAKVLVEGLRRAGNNPSRATLQQALNSMRKVDIGGLEVSFSETDHTGLDFADLSIIGPSGKFVR